MRSFYAWLAGEQETAENPMLRVKVEKGNPPPIRVLGDDELKKLLKACEGTGVLERRD